MDDLCPFVPFQAQAPGCVVKGRALEENLGVDHTEAVLRLSRPRFCVASDVEVATQGAMPGHGSVHTFAGGWGAPLAGVPPCTLQLCPPDGCAALGLGRTLHPAH